MSVEVGSAVAYLELNTSRFTSGLVGAKSALASFSRQGTMAMNSFSASVGKSLQGVGSSIASAGTTLTKGITVPLVGLGGVAVKTAATFESKMSKVKAVSGATASDMKKLSAKAQEMGAKTKFSASESADAFTYMAMAGWKTGDMLDGISGIMSLAAADGLDLATTSDIVTDALTAFGLKAKDSGHFADVLAQASSSANTNVSMLGESFKYCAPVAGAMGYSVEDVTIALGTMANSGIKASSAGTALRSLLTNLAKPTDAIAASMKRYGISLTDAQGNMLPLREVLETLRDRFSNLSEAQKASLAATLAGKTGMSGLLAIVNASEKDWASLSKAINNCDGKADKMSKTMMDNLNGSVTLLKSALEGLAISLGNVLIPTIRAITKHITKFVEKLNGMTEEEKEQVVHLGLLVASAGPVLIAFGKLVSLGGTLVSTFSVVKGAMSAITGVVPMVSSSVSNLIIGFKASKDAIALSEAGLTAFSAEAKASAVAASPLGAALGGITAPVLAVVAAIGVLVAAFAYLWKTNEDFRNNVTGLWNELVGKFSKFFQGITERLNQLGFNFEDISEVIMAAWDALCNLLAPVMEGALKSVVNTVSTCLDIIMSVVDIFVGLFTLNWKQCLNGFKSLFTTTWKYTVNNLKNTLNTMKGVLDVALSWFGTSWKECWNGIVNFFKSIPSKVSSILSNMVSNAKELLKDLVAKGKESGSNFVNGIINFVKNLPYNIGNLLGLALGKVISFAVSMGSKAKELGSNFIKSIITSIKNLPSNLSALFNTAVSKVTSFASSMKAKASDAGSTFLTNLINGINSLPSRAKELLDSTIAKVTNFVKSMSTKGVNAASQFKTSITEGLSSLPSKVEEIGKNIALGLWNGIVSMKDTLISKVKSFGNGIIDGLKSSLDIHSPSRRAKKEVGEMLAQGVIDGVEAKKGAAKKSSKALSDEIVKAAKAKMKKLKANNKVSLQDEVDYWAKIEKACKNGSKAETEAHKKWIKAKKALNKKIKENNAKVLSDAEKYWDKQTTYHTKSAKEEADYWKGVLKKLKKGSDEYLQAYKNYISAKGSIDSEKLSEEEQYLEDTKLYYDVSLKAEMDYWGSLRVTYKEGSEERKEADKKYLDAKEAYTSKLKEIEEGYASEVKRINEELNTTVENLYKEYDDKLKSRVNSIMGTFKLFEGYTFDEASGNTQDLISNLQSQVDAIETYGSELDKIAARGLVPNDMFEELKGLGVGATENLKVINSMTDEELIKYVSLWQQKNSEAVEQAKQELEPLRKSTEDAIAEATKGAEVKLTELKAEFDKNMASINESSSKLANKVGTDILTSIVTGIDSAKSKLNNSLSSVTSSISSTLATVQAIASKIASAVASANASASSIAGNAAITVNGSHKNGLDRVPYDGYIAELHKGERVLTKEETDRMNRSSNNSGDTYIFNSPKAIDEKEAARQMKRAKRELALQY